MQDGSVLSVWGGGAYKKHLVWSAEIPRDRQCKKQRCIEKLGEEKGPRCRS